ncbi:hypothetical protein ACHAXS_008305 [Conticribra weissflogii]
MLYKQPKMSYLRIACLNTKKNPAKVIPGHCTPFFTTLHPKLRIVMDLIHVDVPEDCFNLGVIWQELYDDVVEEYDLICQNL